MDISTTIQSDSTQINADEILTPITVTIVGVERGTPDQPVNILLSEFPERAYRPCKSMRRVLVAGWGADASAYIGRRLTLFNDPTVKWGGSAVGGVRIKAMSHLNKPLEVALTVSRGQRKPFRVDPLADEPTDDFAERIDAATSLAELDAIAADLKARNLGNRRAKLLAQWSARRSRLETDEPVDRSDELLEMAEVNE